MTEQDFEKVKGMIAISCTAEEIASVLGCSPDTLGRRLRERGFDNFADAYKRFAGKGKASLRRLQYKSAEAGNVTMQIWLGKQWLDQSDGPKESSEGDKIVEALREVISNKPG